MGDLWSVFFTVTYKIPLKATITTTIPRLCLLILNLRQNPTSLIIFTQLFIFLIPDIYIYWVFIVQSHLCIWSKILEIILTIAVELLFVWLFTVNSSGAGVYTYAGDDPTTIVTTTTPKHIPILLQTSRSINILIYNYFITTSLNWLFCGFVVTRL